MAASGGHTIKIATGGRERARASAAISFDGASWIELYSACVLLIFPSAGGTTNCRRQATRMSGARGLCMYSEHVWREGDFWRFVM